MTTGRIDVLSIFPEFFGALDVSLIGKARQSGTLEVGVHDLRGWTEDRHRTVDDTPAGGGAGMVMRADVWGRALDEVISGPETTLLIPTPGGEPFTQALARELAEQLGDGGQVVIACGRYEGIDSRVGEHYAGRITVREVSIGDYVLNGGETAAMVIIEAVGRLVPGVVGNPQSLVEESHGSDGLLEYPVYTAPATWRGIEIPEVLRSGDHAKITGWRRAQSLRRTAQVRPDLLAGREVTVRRGKASDAARLHEIAKRTFPLACPPGFDPQEAARFVREHLPAPQFRAWAKSRNAQLWVAELAGVIVGYATVLLREASPEIPEQIRGTTANLSKIYVLPEHHGAGVARDLITTSLTEAARAGMHTMWLGVNKQNVRAQQFYRRHGFAVVGERMFLVGGEPQEDFVMERTLDFASRP